MIDPSDENHASHQEEPAHSEESFPSTVGHYGDLQFLGQGGMARVYRAYDTRLGRSVALKFIRGDDPELAERLLLEARTQARIDHPYVCRVYEVGEIDPMARLPAFPRMGSTEYPFPVAVKTGTSYAHRDAWKTRSHSGLASLPVSAQILMGTNPRGGGKETSWSPLV